MNTFFKRSADGVIVCSECLSETDRLYAVELDPALFPETYELLRCTVCGVKGTEQIPGRSRSKV